MRYFRRDRPENPNFLVGLFLLILLAVFLGPNVLPRVVSSISPTIDTAVPCDWLHRAVDSANHQSLIGRATNDSLALEVRPGPLPLDNNGVLEIDIVVINNSLGTIPIVYNPNQVNIGDDGTSGLGLIFAPGNFQAFNSGRSDATTFAEQNTRLLGPRQQCIHTIRIPAAQLDPNVRAGNAQIHAYYRINSAGQVVQAANTVATPIYNDQGLDILSTGIVESASVQLVAQAQSQ